MIRAWLAHRRRARAGDGREVDPTLFLGAQFDVRDAQIEGLRDALAEALRRAADAERRAAVLEGRLARWETAHLMRRGLQDHMRRGAEQARRLAEEPTAEVTPEQLRRSRPADEPTVHVPQRAPSWSGTPTERRPR